MYIGIALIQSVLADMCHTDTLWAVYKHPKGRPRCLVFNEQFLNLRDSQAVKTKAPENAYVHHVIPIPSAPP